VLATETVSSTANVCLALGSLLQALT